MIKLEELKAGLMIADLVSVQPTDEGNGERVVATFGSLHLIIQVNYVRSWLCGTKLVNGAWELLWQQPLGGELLTNYLSPWEAGELLSVAQQRAITTLREKARNTEHAFKEMLKRPSDPFRSARDCA